ncbi:MAG: PqqD family protein [Anaerolineae bacterium]|nr:PqqD family protein [Anaerolineae bacterium]
MSAETTRYVANPVVSCADEGDEGSLLFNPDTDDSAIINPAGKLIWDFIATPRTRDAIAAHLAGRYPAVPAEQIARDVEQFIAALTPDFIQVIEQHS